METLSQENIADLSIKFESQLNGVYFLLDKNKIVYVGQTTMGLARTFHHLKNKIFDSYYFMPCPIELLNNVESEYIIKFNPKYNKGVGNGKKSIDALKLYLRKMNVRSEDHNKRNLIRLIHELGYELQPYLNQCYISEECFNKVSKVLIGVNK